MRMAIQGLGPCTAAGNGVEALRQALQQGGCQPQSCTVDREDRIDTFNAYRASSEGLDQFFSRRTLRRVDHYARMALLGASLALQDAGAEEIDRSRLGVVIATGYGALKTTFDFLDSYLDFGYACSSPTHFSNSVHNAAAAQISIQMHASAPSLTVTQFELSVASALLSAQQWLATGRVDQVLFGAVDEYCDVLRYCRSQLFGSNEAGPLQPYRFEQQSAMLGEGACFFLLDAKKQARYGFIDEVVMGNHQRHKPQLTREALLILGADGHAVCGAGYAELLGDRPGYAYAPIYGSFPTAAACDLAVAALSLADGFLSPPPERSGASAVINGEPRRLRGEQLACLKLDASGGYGLLRLSA